jgi:hypothetical protein
MEENSVVTTKPVLPNGKVSLPAKVDFLKRIAKVRLTFQNLGVKKTGKNKFLNFDYFELDDILPVTNSLCYEYDLVPVYALGEIATLTIYDVLSDNFLVFSTKTAAAELREKNGGRGNPIQEIGSENTYTKRYLYLNFLEISEPDTLDASIGKPTAAKTSFPAYSIVDEGSAITSSTPPTGINAPASAKQLEILNQILTKDELSRMLAHYGHSEISEITIGEASATIAKRKGANNG